MKSKLNLIAAAAVLAASGVAHAAFDTGKTSGNGSLLLNVSFGNNTAGSSALFDLGLTFSDVELWQASIASTVPSGNEWYREWNLTTGVLSGTGLTPTTVGSYGTTFSDFLTAAGANLSTAQFNVFAFDGTGTEPGETAIYTTHGGLINASTGAAQQPTTTALNVLNGTYNGLQGGVTVINFLAANNLLGTHPTDVNGASFANAGSLAYFNNGTGMERFGNTAMFDSNGRFFGQYPVGSTTFAGANKSLPFFRVTASSNNPIERASLSAVGYDIDGDNVIEFDNNGTAVGGLNEYGLWTLQGDVLRFSVAAVPEPESYAMLMAGLGLMGAIARRRRAGN